MNVLKLDGRRYLVAPRGTTEWVRNLRAAGAGELHIGRRVETFQATELADTDKLPVLREYLRRWAWEVGKFFEGIDKDSTDAELTAAAPGFPVFALAAAPDPYRLGNGARRGTSAWRGRRAGNGARDNTAETFGP